MAQTVLIAEDDADIVELLSLYLAAAGFQVLTAADGEQALATVREHPVDVAASTSYARRVRSATCRSSSCPPVRCPPTRS